MTARYARHVSCDRGYQDSRISFYSLEIRRHGASATVPYYRHVIKAGNGAHVLTDEVEEFDVEAHYANTCVYEVGGDSMVDADIQEGDRLVVKLGHRFPNNSIILCRYNGDLMVKGARIQDGVIWLIPANQKMHPWACKESDQFEAIGVVIEVIRIPSNAPIRRKGLTD